MLTLCDVYDNHNPAKIEIDNGNANISNSYIISFGALCNVNNNETQAMSPFKYDHQCSTNDQNDGKCSSNGSWRKGIVEENMTANGTVVGEATEALYFDGADYLTALVDKSDCWDNGGAPNCSRTVNYVDLDKKTPTEKLNLTDGIAISAWVKRDDGTGIQTIVSKWYNDKGYKLWIENDDKIGFQLNDDVFSVPLRSYKDWIKNDEWAHIVAVWKYDDSNPSNSAVYVYVNGEAVKDSTFAGPIEAPNGDIPLSIGVQLKDDGSRNISPVVSTYFKGAIDDVRIWKRALTGEEINRLCVDAFDQNTSPTGAPTCHDPDDSHSY
jgi:hypothetical protein